MKKQVKKASTEFQPSAFTSAKTENHPVRQRLYFINKSNKFNQKYLCSVLKLIYSL